MKDKSEWISIGFIHGVHGIKGEVKVFPLTDHPPRFKTVTSALVELPGGESRELELEKVRLRGDKIYLKFYGIESREQSLRLKGAYIKIKREECLKLPADRYYIFDLIGLEVKTLQGESLGHITDVWNLPANDVYIVSFQNKEILIPAIAQVVKQIDLEKRLMIIDPIEGLIE
ncbi:MAG: ribosome maturation factor RimM [candidate division KSB1 bacterium]|nr:ribosome maturation factor RimM [candidate division KSB1 bacterium]